MSAADQGQHGDTLHRIAVNLQKINSTLEHLVGAVEEVSVVIEKTHEPEGDTGSHLVRAIHDLTQSIRRNQNGGAVRHDRGNR